MLHRGGTPRAEEQALYLELAGSRVPLAGEDLALLAALAAECAEGPQPERIPVRENRAVINKVALAGGRPLLADTVTDVLRLAAAVSGGDVTLETATRFRSFARPERRVIMAALDSVVRESPAKLTDVARYAEPWKRLGERLHPHEHGQFPHAQRVFAVARGEERFPSLASRAEQAFREGETARAARRLADAPGLLFRSLDRLLRGATAADRAVDHGPRRAGGAVRVRAGAAVGAGALPEPGRGRWRGPAEDLRQPQGTGVGDAGDPRRDRPGNAARRARPAGRGGRGAATARAAG